MRGGRFFLRMFELNGRRRRRRRRGKNDNDLFFYLKLGFFFEGRRKGVIWVFLVGGLN